MVDAGGTSITNGKSSLWLMGRDQLTDGGPPVADSQWQHVDGGQGWACHCTTNNHWQLVVMDRRRQDIQLWLVAVHLKLLVLARQCGGELLVTKGGELLMTKSGESLVTSGRAAACHWMPDFFYFFLKIYMKNFVY